MGCCGSKKTPETIPNTMRSSTVKLGGANNIRLPKPLASPYPNDQVDIKKYLDEHCQEGEIYQPGEEIVPKNLNEMAN